VQWLDSWSELIKGGNKGTDIMLNKSKLIIPWGQASKRKLLDCEKDPNVEKFWMVDKESLKDNNTSSKVDVA